MINNSESLKAKIRNLSMGDSKKSLARNAFIATCTSRQSEQSIIQIDDIIEKIGSSEIMEEQWNTYCKKNSYVADLSWKDVITSTSKLRNLAAG